MASAVLAAWLHVALAAVHPFVDGNGRTARVLASLAMYRGGFRHPAFTSLEEWWGKHPQATTERSTAWATFDPAADVTPFVSTMSRPARPGARLALRQRTDGSPGRRSRTSWKAGLPSRLANALYDSFFDRDITTGYYRDDRRHEAP